MKTGFIYRNRNNYVLKHTFFHYERENLDSFVLKNLLENDFCISSH